MTVTFNSTLSHKDLVKNANILFKKGKEAYPEVLRKSGLVREINIASNTGDTRTFSEMDVESFARNKGEGEAAKKRKTVQGYTKIGKMTRRASETDITWELKNYGKYPEIASGLTNLGKEINARLSLDLAHRIGFGFATSYVDMDGQTIDLSVGDTKALFDNAHTLKASSKTFRNTLNGNAPFSKSALQDMINMRRDNRLDHFGVRLTGKDDIIWTTEDESTVEAVEELLRSTASTTNEKNSGVYNRYNGRYSHLAIPNLDTDANGQPDDAKAKFWGVADSSMSDLVLGMHKEAHLKIGEKGTAGEEDFSTDTTTLGSRGSYMIVTPSAKWIAASKGDNS